MRIYQVLVIGSFVALAACKDETTENAGAGGAPVAEAANDAGAPRDDADATGVDNPSGGRPEGAVDPIRTPEPSP